MLEWLHQLPCLYPPCLPPQPHRLSKPSKIQGKLEMFYFNHENDFKL